MLVMTIKAMTMMTVTQMTALQGAGGQAAAGQLVQPPHPAARGEAAGQLQQQPAARTQMPHPALAGRGAGPGGQRRCQVGFSACDMVVWGCSWVKAACCVLCQQMLPDIQQPGAQVALTPHTMPDGRGPDMGKHDRHVDKPCNQQCKVPVLQWTSCQHVELGQHSSWLEGWLGVGQHKVASHLRSWSCQEGMPSSACMPHNSWHLTSLPSLSAVLPAGAPLQPLLEDGPAAMDAEEADAAAEGGDSEQEAAAPARRGARRQSAPAASRRRSSTAAAAAEAETGAEAGTPSVRCSTRQARTPRV